MKAKKTNTPKHYIAYIGLIGDPIWGNGRTTGGALREGKHWVKDYNQYSNSEDRCNPSLLKVRPASPELIEEVDAHGGGDVSWCVVKGVAVLA